jgi:hypothetical protein
MAKRHKAYAMIEAAARAHQVLEMASQWLRPLVHQAKALETLGFKGFFNW